MVVDVKGVISIKGVIAHQYKNVQSDYKNEKKQYLVYAYLTVFLGQARANVRYPLFTLTEKFAGLLVVKEVMC